MDHSKYMIFSCLQATPVLIWTSRVLLQAAKQDRILILISSYMGSSLEQ